MKINFFYLLILLLPSLNSNAQQTVGLFLNDSLAFNGYILFGPLFSTTTHLIDNCGKEVNRWNSNFNPGNSAYLMENGNLLRPARIANSVFSLSGVGGRLEEFDWDGNLLWSFEYSNDKVYQHHDIEVLPNGNILLIAFEYKTPAEAIEQGRDPSTLGVSLWPNHIVEIEKVNSNQAKIVWEWHTWDHLVQDFDSTKANYGVIADHPELIDLNYISGSGNNGGSDWMHCNSVDYNAELDQIILSSRNFSEVWIIDHSTTTEEASDHTGGTYGKGGDLLYRFGNPQVYDRGNIGDQVFKGQHDAYWIPNGYPNAGKIMVFNNHGGDNGTSTIDIITPPVDSAGVYSDPGNNAFGPDVLTWRYTSPGFFSGGFSSARVRPNGNVLICEGTSGNLFEITPEEQVVWNYICPVDKLGPVQQGSVPDVNYVFRAYPFAPDFSGFNGKDLTPGDPIELNPLPYDCVLFNEIITETKEQESLNIQITNPIHNSFTVWIPFGLRCDVSLYNVTGERIMQTLTLTETQTFDASRFAPGLYFFQVIQKHPYRGCTKKIIKY